MRSILALISFAVLVSAAPTDPRSTPFGEHAAVVSQTRERPEPWQWNSANKTPTLYPAPNGWKVAEVFIPLTEINIAVSGSGAGNMLDLVWMTYEDTVQNEIHEGRYYWMP
jgi:hypothetical protein